MLNYTVTTVEGVIGHYLIQSPKVMYYPSLKICCIQWILQNIFDKEISYSVSPIAMVLYVNLPGFGIQPTFPTCAIHDLAY